MSVLYGLVCMCLSVLFPLMARCHFLCPERQRKQNALFSSEGRKLKNHRQGLYKLIFSLPFLLTFVAVFGRCLSVIVSVSPLCFEGALFRTALFKTASLCLFATLCYCHTLYISHCLPLQFTLCSLP